MKNVVGIGFEVTQEEVELVMKHREAKAKEERIAEIATEIQKLIKEAKEIGYVQVKKETPGSVPSYGASMRKVAADKGYLTFYCA